MSHDLKPQLPRGLVNREGTAVRTNQRLPSLRGDPLSGSHAMLAKLANASNTSGGSMSMPNATGSGVNNTTTRGGVAKRVYKPSIPTRRTPGTSNTSNDGDSKRGHESRYPRGRGGRGNKKERPQQNFLQLEAAVFNGINASISKSSRGGSVAASSSNSSRETVTRVALPVSTGGGSGGGGVTSHAQAKTDINTSAIKNLYKDDFIGDSDSDDDDGSLQVKPKGWENVSHDIHHHNSKKARRSDEFTGIPIDKWLEADEKLFLMQVPDILVKRPKGLVGKLRIYKSGRFEIVDSETGVTFDLVRANSNPTRPGQVKSEVKPSKAQLGYGLDQTVNQEIVHLSSDAMVSLSRIETEDVLIAVPRIPDS